MTAAADRLLEAAESVERSSQESARVIAQAERNRLALENARAAEAQVNGGGASR